MPRDVEPQDLTGLVDPLSGRLSLPPSVRPVLREFRVEVASDPHSLFSPHPGLSPGCPWVTAGLCVPYFMAAGAVLGPAWSWACASV